MIKKLCVILSLSGIISAFLLPNAVSRAESAITFGWDTLDYGRPTINSSYFIGNGSTSNGSLYQSLLETLPSCQTLVEIQVPVTDCIESLESQVGNENWVSGKLVRYLPVRWQPRFIKISDAASNILEFSDATIDIPSDSAANTYTGSRGALWTFNGVNHSIGNEFIFFVDTYGVAKDGRVDWSQGFIKSNLYPVSVSDVRFTTLRGLDGSGTCVTDSSRRFCLKKGEFPRDIRFRVTLRLNKAAASISSERWFVSRTSNPSLTITSSGTDQALVFEGGPVTVQVPTIRLPREENLLRAFVKSWISSTDKDLTDLEANVKRGAEYYLKSGGITMSSNSEESTKVFAGWDPFMKYATINELSGWNFTNQGAGISSSPLYSQLSQCPKSANYPGLVASNSTAVEPGPPTLNTTDDSLEYRVSAPHLNAEGTKNTGT